MRIVGGIHKGRAIAAPAGRDTRPTADRARQALFDVLSHGLGLDFEGISVLDVFAGSGALGLEALSRGAARAWFLEHDRRAAEAIRANIRSLGETNARVLQLDATRPPPAEAACGLVFLDPPYGSGLAGPALEALARRGWLAAGAVTVVEVAAGESLTPPAGFSVVDERRWGAARFVLMRAPGTSHIALDNHASGEDESHPEA